MRFGSQWICDSLSAAEGIENQFHAARDAQLVENPKHVVSYRVLGQVELQCDFLVPHPFRDQAYDLSFARCQPSHPPRLLNLQGSQSDYQLEKKLQLQVADPDLPLMYPANALRQCVERIATAEHATRTASKRIEDEIALCGIQ